MPNFMIFPSPKGITKVLVCVVVGLTLASVAGQFSRYFLGHDHLLGIIPLFRLTGEGLIPTWYSSSALFLCGFLLAMIAYSKTMECAPYSRHWAAMSIIFLCLSLDEQISIHEEWGIPMRAVFNASGFFYFTWVIAGMAFVLIFVLAYLRFLAALPPKTRLLFIVAGTVYIGGALGMEMVGARYAYLYGREPMTYQMIAHVEDVLEMLGVVVFIYALLSYISSQVKELPVRMNDEEPTTRAH